MDQTQQMIVFGIVVVLGLVSTVVYYFARYYFRTHDEDEEVVKGATVDASKFLADKSAEPDLIEQIREKAEEKVLEPARPTPLEKTELAKPESAEPEPAKPKELKDALSNTRASLFGRLKDTLFGKDSLSADDLETVEEILYTSDLGPQTVQRLLGAVDESLQGSEKNDLEKVRQALRGEISSIFSGLHNEDAEASADLMSLMSKAIAGNGPHVWMVVGVNGAGKTTTIGKLAHKAVQMGLKTMVVAGDTFRAAAEDQLKVWSERAKVEIFSPPGVTDPSAVAFDAITSAKTRDYDLVIVDTAGRLHTQSNLMDELKKMKRVMAKVLDGAPHETIIVLDANSGQNALIQAKMFNESLGLSGVVLTKLDGSAKGGVAVGLACELGLPIKLIGVGEGIEDLRPFHSQEFVDSIL